MIRFSVKRKTMNRKYIRILLAVSIPAILFLLILLLKQPCNHEGARQKETQKTDSARFRYGLNVNDYRFTDSVIPQGAAFGVLMETAGVPGHRIHEMVTLADTVFDLRKIRAGNACVYIREMGPEANLKWFIYHVDVVNYVLFDFGDPLQVAQYALEVDTMEHQYSGIILSSLWNAMVTDHKNYDLILKLSDIFAWEIDFYGIQKGDRFKIIYDELFVEGESIGTGNIYAAWFEHAGKEFYAFRYLQDSAMVYFDETGNSLRREFLKAPLEFRRISSRFSHSRLHPILRRYRPHHGVDYAAPSGTPVRAIGDGTVLEARYAGGAGRMVKIRHNSIYTTVYMHLRGFAKGIKNGRRIKQGDVIGYVGSSGLSTGPHLDFRIYKNGTPVNPLKVESPPAKPIEPDRLEQYKQDISELRLKLDRIPAKALADAS